MISKDKFYREVGKRIREVRERKGISLKEFESYDNSISRSALSRIETGSQIPMLYTLHKIAEILEVDISEFLKK